MIPEQSLSFRRFFRSKMMLVFEVLLLVIVSVALAREVVRRYQIQGEIRKLEGEAAQLERQKAELGNLISYLGSDTFKEEQARLKLGLQKPGESVVAVLGESTAATATEPTAATATTEKTTTMTNPQRWWNYFITIKKER